MGKSSRASSVKKNNQRLKKNVFGPVETARNERLSAKLLELASQPKPPRTEMEVERDAAQGPETDRKTDAPADEDIDMDADGSSKSTARKNDTSKKQRPRSPRVEKKRHRKVKNSIVFPMRHVKSKKGKKR